MVIMWAARNNNSGRRRKVMFVDISKAHLYAPVQEGRVRGVAARNGVNTIHPAPEIHEHFMIQQATEHCVYLHAQSQQS